MRTYQFQAQNCSIASNEKFFGKNINVMSCTSSHLLLCKIKKKFGAYPGL